MSRRWIILLFCLTFPLVVLPYSAASGGLRVNEATTRILLREGQVQLAMENSTGREIAAFVHLQLLDVEDEVRAETTRDELIQPGTSRIVVPLQLPPPTPGATGSGQVLWYRLRVRVSPSSPTDSAVSPVEEIIALSEITPDIFKLQVAAPHFAREGTRLRLHVRATHPISSRPVDGVSVAGEVDFENERKATPLKGTGTTDAEGYITLDFNLPGDLKKESGNIRVVGQLGNLVQEARDGIRIDHSARILLNTDKPLYQPGQVVRIRALIFDPSRRAMPEADATLKISDTEGTTVFRAALKTSRFGIASADWTIPESTRLGDYNVRVEMDEGGDDNSASQGIRISRYDLPNFAVTVKPDREYYLPGQSAEVEVRGDYLFGEPVTRGHVRVVRETERQWSYSEQKWATQEGAKVEGEIDREGRFVAHINLEEEQNELAQSSEQRYRDLTYAAYLTDPTTNRTEQRRFDLRLTKDAIHVYVTEANYNQAEGLPLEFYLSTFYADGTPARCEVAISEEVTATTASTATTHHGLGTGEPEKRERLLRRVATNRFGVAKVSGPVIAKSKDGSRQMRFILAARDRKGKTGHQNEGFSVSDSAAIRVETDKALYRAGDPIKARIIANKPDLTVILDVARDLQIIRSEVVRLSDGQAFITLPYSADFKDRLTIAASSTDVPQSSYYYQNFVTGRRTVLYPRDRELKLDVQLGQDTYRPGEDATADIQISTPDGRAVEGALGVVVLDKAVEERARTNQEFGAYGFYNNFHSFLYGHDDLAGVTHRDLERLDLLHHGVPEGIDLAAEVLLQRAHNSYGLSFYGGREYIPNHLQVFYPRISTQLQPIGTALRRHYINTTEYPVDEHLLRRVLAASGIDFDALRDPWGVPYRAVFSVDRASDVTEMWSAGPDKRFGTTDDFSASRITWPYFRREGEKINRAVAEYHERTGKFIRDAATFKSELRRVGLEFDTLRDRWGRPYSLSFGLSGVHFSVNIKSGGPNGAQNYLSDDFSIWTTWSNYFAETIIRIDAALAAYSRATGRFPSKEAELRDALRGSGAELDKLRDAWGGRYYVDYKTEVVPADYALNINPPAQSGEQSNQRARLMSNTRQVSRLRFFSFGPDGRGGTYDDVTAANFTSTNYEKDRRGQNQRIAAAPVSLTGGMGMVNGSVLDPTGAAIAGAKVTVTDTFGVEREVITNEEGCFGVTNLVPGFYTIRIEHPGFKTTIIQNVEVVVGGTNIITANLEVGEATATVEITDVAQIDQSSTAVGNNLNDRVFQNIAVQRGASGLFYLSPGGSMNTSLAGGAALDNAYIADGVNSTDSALGGKGAMAGAGQQQSPISTPRLREYFPETLLWQPALETDASGRARLNFKLADNITTWKMSVIGSTVDGEVGTAETDFRAFQPFFVEHDPPRVLTEGDEIDLPVVLRNYMEKAQTVDLEIKPESWFALLGPAQKRAEVAARDATRETFPLRAVASVDEGRQRITATGTEASDAIEKPVRVHPDGQEVAITDSEIFVDAARLEANIPGDAINGSVRAELKIYPHLMSHVIESVEGILQRPYGCGEQTISSTYPSVMVLRAYKRNGGTPPPKARRYAQEGYERLLNYRAASGGFAYWARGDADLALTAYALRLLNDARDVLAVDEEVVRKAREWLIEQQQEDGSWSGGNWHGATDGASTALNTSYIARVLAVTKPGGASTKTDAESTPAASHDPLARAFNHLSRHVDKMNEPYLAASYALAAMDAGRKTEAAKAVNKLRAFARPVEGGMNYWAVETSTPFYGWGLTGQIETTALAVQALTRSSRELAGKDKTMQGATDDNQLIGRGMLFLIRNKDRYGVWYSTQATINVLNTLIGASDAGVKGDEGGTAEVIVNGRPAASVVMPQGDQISGPLYVDISKFISSGSNRVEIRRAGDPAAPATAQLVSTYWIPWPVSRTVNVTNLNHAASSALRFSVAFDKKEVKIRDEVTCRVNAGRVGPSGYGMLLAEIGLPPGADVDRASLERAMKDSDGSFSRYDILPDRLIVYLWPRKDGIRFEFKFRPRYGLAAQTAASLLYDYYNPEARTVIAPTKFMVR